MLPDASRGNAHSHPTRIGKYRIIRQLAQGGMAEIYLASASGIEGFEKLCVLKRILPLLANNKEFVDMFLDEARIAASLLHSNIAQVFDIGSDSGSYYFVMELLRGEDVRHILKESAARQQFIAYEHIVSIIVGVCAGLHHAHEMRGKDGKPLSIVHRDISPQNVFVTRDGSVKLCDFGIAKSAARLTETRVGTLKGKVRYMSPEQCQSEPLDRRSDLFSLAILLWELITSRRLYRGKGDYEICKEIVETPAASPSGFRPDVPAGLEAIVMKGLNRNRDERYQTAQELQVALEDWAHQDRVPVSSVRLGIYMTDLFGKAPTEAESFLQQSSEHDPLARRIKALNANDASDSGVINTQASLARADTEGTNALNSDLSSASGNSIAAVPRSDQSLELDLVAMQPRPKGVVYGAIGAGLVILLLLGMLLFRSSGPPPQPVADKPPPAVVSPTPPPPVAPVATHIAPVEPPPSTLGVTKSPDPVEPPRHKNTEPGPKRVKPSAATTATPKKKDEANDLFPP